MKLTLTNTAWVAVPVVSEAEGGWVESLEPNKPIDIDRSATDVIIIGDKPSVTESIEQGMQVLAGMVKALLTAWKGREKGTQGAISPMVEVTIENNGEKPVRVIQGDPTNDVNLNPGESMDAQAKGYVELRELGG